MGVWAHLLKNSLSLLMYGQARVVAKDRFEEVLSRIT